MKKTIAIILGLVVAAGIAYFVHNRSSATSFNWPTSNEAAKAYMHFSKPHGKSIISASAAEATASKYWHDNAVGARFYYCVDTSKVPELHQDCWVILMNPTHLPYPSTPASGKKAVTAWLIVLINSNNGKGIEWVQGAKP